MSIRDILLCVLIAFLWGVNYLMVKIAVTAFEPMTAMTIRYFLVTLCLCPFLLRIPRALYWPVFKVSMSLGLIYFALFFWAANHVSPSLASIVLQLQVPFGLIFSMLLLKEPPSGLGIFGTVLAFIGVFFAVGKIEWSATLLAIVLLFIAAASWGYGSVLVRHLKLAVDPLTLNAAIAFCSLPFLIILMFGMEPHPLARVLHAGLISWSSMMYMVLISTIFCYASWFKLIGRYSVAMIIPAMLLVPVFAILCSKLFLKETITLNLSMGTAITLVGVSLVILPKGIAAFRRKSL